jgi:hypothetical protein
MDDFTDGNQKQENLLSRLQAIAGLSQTALNQLALNGLPEPGKEHPLKHPLKPPIKNTLEQALVEEALLQQTLLQRSEHINTLLQTPVNTLKTMTMEELTGWKQFIHQHEQLGQLLKQRHHHLAQQLEQVQQHQTQLRKYHSQATLY